MDRFFWILTLLFFPLFGQVEAPLHVYLEKKLDDPFLSFVALTQEADKPPQFIALGVTQRSPPVEATDQSLYRIASSTKMFVATAAIKYAIAGKLHLDDPLTKYLGPKYLEGIRNADQVTIRQLMGMQTGIYNYTDNPQFGAFIEAHPDHHWTPLDALRFARNQPPEFAAGTASKYSNTNYILLGLVIEKASGRTLVDALNEQVFQPLHLEHTFLEQHQPIPYPIAESYVYLGEGKYRLVTTNSGYGLADGGIVSNVQDMNTFIRNLMLNRAFMPQAWLDQMLDFHPLISTPPVEYGLGVIRFQYGELVLEGHDGDDTGRQSWMVFDPASKKSLVMISNTRPPYFDHKAIALEAFGS